MSKRWIVGVLCLTGMGWTQPGYVPAPENLRAREWFQDAKFGLFIHWGVYSLLGEGEWVMQIRKIPVRDYEKLASFFNPVDFDPDAWVSLAKDAGMKYITITSKHHDGFCLFDSKLTDWDIVDRTPYGRDVLKPLAEACHREGICLFFYYSQLDWHHPDYFPRGWTGREAGRPESGEWDRYIDYMNGQLRELLTGYGPVAGIWFDGWWDKKEADWRLDETYRLIHTLQPACLIGSNHHQAPNPGEDFQMFEKDLPGRNTAGFSGDATIGTLPLETCETMNHSWGFNITDRAYKSSRELIRYLVRAAGNNANFLLNVGPMPNGQIQPEFADTLRLIGRWLERYGETIYGTRGGPVPEREWGVTTQKGGTVYVHVLNRIDDHVFLSGFKRKGTVSRLFPTGEKVAYEVGKYGTILRLPDCYPDEVDLVVEIRARERVKRTRGTI